MSLSTLGDNDCYICQTDVGLKSEENYSRGNLSLKKKVCDQFHKFLSTFINLKINVANVKSLSKNKRQLNNNALCCDDCFVSVQKFCKTYESFQMELLQILDGFSNLMKTKNTSKAATKFQKEFIWKVCKKRQREFRREIRRHTAVNIGHFATAHIKIQNEGLDLDLDGTPVSSGLPICRVITSPESPIPSSSSADLIDKIKYDDDEELNIPSDGDEFPLLIEKEMGEWEVQEQDPLEEDYVTVDEVLDQEPAIFHEVSNSRHKYQSTGRVCDFDSESHGKRKDRKAMQKDSKDKDYGPMNISGRNSRQRYDCLMCTKSFLKGRNLLAHLRRHTNENVHHCQVCQMEFQTRELLTGHQTRVHKVSATDDTMCDICQEKFDTTTARNQHLAKVHEDEKKFVCEECGKKFLSRPCLIRHKMVHLNKTERPFECDLCPAKFRLKEHLTKHKSKVHNPEYKERQKQLAKTKICEVCGKGFVSRRPLLIHKAAVHGEKNEVDVTKIRKRNLESYNTKLNYKCPYENCDRAYNQKRNFDDHIASHKGEKNYVCDNCGKSYTHRTTLHKHVRYSHSEKNLKRKNNFKCHYENCGRAFNSRNNLKGHLASHTGEKNYHCDHCGKSFAQTPNLKRHVKKCHGANVVAAATETAEGERKQDDDQGVNVNG